MKQSFTDSKILLFRMLSASKSFLIQNFHKKLVLFLLSFFLTATLASANPVLENIGAGNVQIQQSPNTTTINQSSSQAIINWQSFNINQGQAVHFVQPAGGIALNRINPQSGPSQIYGVLTATGQIILVNAAGIYFGPTAYVNVGSLIATTANISDLNFMSRNYQFNSPGPGSVINAGTIIAAEHGLAALVGSNVTNTGLIQANLGHVILTTGDDVTIDFAGNDLINFDVGKNTSNDGNITNTGEIIANGGAIEISANAAQSVLDNAIDMQGVAIANSVSSQGGEIILNAGNGTANISGKLIASGQQPGLSGGSIMLLGNQVNLTGNALVDVSGDAGGGTVLIGGNYHGAGPEPNADDTYFGSNVIVNASALLNGNGGSVVDWSNDNTQFNGNIIATGGLNGGNGGSVEVSSHQLLDFAGTVNLLAPEGSSGTLLLDPENLTIQSAGSTNAYLNSGTYTSDLDDSIITVADLENALANANVTLQTGSLGPQAGDITVADSFSWNNANSLTLNAYRNITIDSGVTITNTAGGSLTLHANNTGSAFDVGSGYGIVTNNGTLNMSGGGQVNIFYNPSSYSSPAIYTNTGTDAVNAYMLVNNATDLQNVSTNLNGAYALGDSFTAGSSFTPLGSTTTPFTGIFNGNFNTISNLVIDTGAAVVGLFGEVSNALIENLALNNVSVTNTGSTSVLGIGDTTGSLAGYVTGTSIIKNIFSSGSVTYDSIIDVATNVGGLLGDLDTGATVIGVYTIANVISEVSTASADATIGGLVGANSGTITNSAAQGTISMTGGTILSVNVLGGLTGSNTGSISNSYSAISSVSSGGLVSVPVAGGFIGANTGTVSSDYWDNTLLSGYSSCGVGSCTPVSPESTSAMQSQGTFTGFDFSSSWGISSGNYPYLQVFPPRIISGTVPSTGGTVNLYDNSTLIASQVIASGNSTFSFSNNYDEIADNDVLLLDLSGFDNSVNNIVAVAPLAGGSLTGLNMTQNANITLVNLNNTPVLNGTLAAAAGSLNTTNLLYSYSGNNITLGNATYPSVTLTTTTPTPFSVDGSITNTSGGSAALTFNGAVELSDNISSNADQTYILPVTLGASSTLSGAALNMQYVQLENNTLTLSPDADTGAISNVISGTGGLTLTSGEETLSGNNTYSGVTNINGGILNITSLDGLGNSSAINVASGATLDVDVTGTLANANTLTLYGNGAGGVGSLELSANNITIQNPIDLGSDVLISGNGSGTMTFSGSITGGDNLTIQLDNAGVSLPATTLTAGGDLSVSSAGKISQTGAVSVSGTSSFNAGDSPIDLTTNGSGNDFTGAVSLDNTGDNNATLYNSAALILNQSSIGENLAIAAQGLLTIAGNINSINNGTLSFAGSGITVNSSVNAETSSNNISMNAGANSLTLDSAAQVLTSGVITLTGDSMSFDSSASPAQIGGSGSGTGSAATVILAPSTSGTSIGIAGGSGNLQLNANALTDIRADNVRIGDYQAGNINIGAWTTGSSFADDGILTLDTAGNITQSGAMNLSTGNTSLLIRDASGVTLTNDNSISNIAAQLANGVSLDIANTGSSALAVASLTDDLGTVNGVSAPGGVIMTSSHSGIVLNQPVTTTSGNIVLAGTSFINNDGSSALNPGTGDYQVWSVNPSNDSLGGLNYNFIQYDAMYGMSTVLGTGNGFLYSIAPVITVGLTGTVSKIYDATTAAALGSGNYTVSGAIDGDTVNINYPLSGAYANKNVDTGIDVSVSGISVASASNGNAAVYGYQVNSTASADIGTITPASLLITGVTANNKVYDGNTIDTLNTGSAELSGVYSGDVVNLNSSNAIGMFADSSVGNNKPVIASGFSINGASASDYTVTQPAGLTADITPNTNTNPTPPSTGPQTGNPTLPGSVTNPNPVSQQPQGPSVSGIITGATSGSGGSAISFTPGMLSITVNEPGDISVAPNIITGNYGFSRVSEGGVSAVGLDTYFKRKLPSYKWVYAEYDINEFILLVLASVLWLLLCLLLLLRDSDDKKEKEKEKEIEMESNHQAEATTAYYYARQGNTYNAQSVIARLNQANISATGVRGMGRRLSLETTSSQEPDTTIFYVEVFIPPYSAYSSAYTLRTFWQTGQLPANKSMNEMDEMAEFEL